MTAVNDATLINSHFEVLELDLWLIMPEAAQVFAI